MFYLDGKYYMLADINKVLGTSPRKAGDFDSTKVLAEEKPMSYMTPMPIGSKMEPAVVGIPTKPAHSGQSKQAAKEKK